MMCRSGSHLDSSYLQTTEMVHVQCVHRDGACTLSPQRWCMYTVSLLTGMYTVSTEMVRVHCLPAYRQYPTTLE